MMVAARSRSAASGGKNSVHTDGNGGTNEMAKRNGRRAIVTAKCAGDNGSSSSSSSSGGSGIITAVAGHRSQRGVVNCFLRFIFLRNMFILLVVISGLLVSTADAVISSRVGFSPKFGETRKVATDTGLGCGVPSVLLLLLLLLLLYSATIPRRQAGA
uniref:Uncharacterized protein n=1 Tax=Anopheles merus TaxID=30066 RepID=A0A182UZ69_ANOME